MESRVNYTTTLPKDSGVTSGLGHLRRVIKTTSKTIHGPSPDFNWLIEWYGSGVESTKYKQLSQLEMLIMSSIILY